MISNPTVKHLQDAIHSAGDLYHRLILIVGNSGTGKTSILRNIANEFQVRVINLNLELSRELLELSARQRALRLPTLLASISNDTQSLLIIDNIEILFDKDLRQDPLRLLQGLSRNRTVLVSWNGLFKSGKLVYAEPGHPEHRSYDTVDALIVSSTSEAVSHFGLKTNYPEEP